ncbi:MAG: J domain-containing protein [Nanoarchaeota archaeon]|nr:J domain-containing protein [Nanoarchaeota archaeon]
MVDIKGYNFREIVIRDSYNRRALQFKNQIITYLRKFGLTEDDVEIPLEGITIRKAQASASWYMWEEHLFFSYNRSTKFVENLAMVAQVIKHFLNLLDKEEITQEEFLKLFAEDKDVVKQRKEARETLGVEEDSTDFETIHQNYKKLSKELHPDMPNGNTERFKRINTAHKILKKELS